MAATEPITSAGDMLEKAGCITRFLADVAPLLHDEGGHGMALSERGACGLFHLLTDVESLIEKAVDLL